MVTLKQKLAISASSAGLFLGLNLPFTYKLTNYLIGDLWNTTTSCPTTLGLLLHSGVFFVLTYLSMGKSASNIVKASRSLSASLVFLLFSSPFAYIITQSLLGSIIANTKGCPTQWGLVVHTLVYILVLTALMYD